MKQTLLLLSFLLINLVAFAQRDSNCSSCDSSAPQNYSSTQNASLVSQHIDLSIYPNPATDYIGLSDNDSVGRIMLYNLVGKRMKTYDYAKGETYYVADLPSGMYLVQLIGKNNKIIATQRVSKR